MKLLKLVLFIMFVLSLSNLFASDIIFSGEANGNFDLYRTDTAFSYIKRITKTNSNEIMPTTNSDGSKIAFICDKDGANSLYMLSKKGCINISAGVGAYANPTFSPDGKKIAVRYAPDPEELLKATKIVLLDPISHTQKIIIDSTRLAKQKTTNITMVVDRPVWLSRSLLAYVVIEYSDIEAGKISKSTIYMLNLSEGNSIRIAGGESYFDAKGKSLGFKATMPSSINSKEGKLLAFAAIRGTFDRTVMGYLINKKAKRNINLKDEDFFGPLLYDGSNWIYGYRDENGILGIAVKKGQLNSKRLVMPFKGKALSPVLIR